MGIAYQALVNWSLFGRTTFDLGAGKKYQLLLSGHRPYYLLTSARLLVTQPLPGWFELYGGFDWQHMAYRWLLDADTTRASRTASTRSPWRTAASVCAWAGLSRENRRRKDAAAIDRRSGAEFQPHEDPDHRDGGFGGLKMRCTLLTLIVLAWGCTARIRAGESPGARGSAGIRSSRARCADTPGTDYVVGPLDVLNVRIYGEDKLSGKIRIDNDGSFPFEYLGRVKAEGMTTAQIETYLAKALGDGYLRNPQVSVEVIEYRSQSVFVTGEVRSPNKYMLPGNSTLMDVLTLAGSVTPNAGHWVQITHARQGAEVLGPAASADYDVRVNLRDIQTGKAQNIKMRDGDTIFVPKAERVWVVGQVRNPQGVVHEEGMTVFEAIAAAGGITEKGSNSRIEIVRIENGQRKSIDAKQTDVLKPGDQVNVRTRRL